MLPLFFAALFLASPDSTVLPSPRIVRQLDSVEVRMRRHLTSTQTIRDLSAAELRRLPVDGLHQVMALQPGVVVQGGEVHVRGGRAGELSILLGGIALNEPRRGAALEMPLLATRSAELVSGGFPAEYGGALAGVLDLHPVDPGDRWEGEGRIQSSTSLGGRYDRVMARWGGPISALGLGIMATGDVTLDDTHLPALRTNGRRRVLGSRIGWRADDRLLGHARITTRNAGPRVALDVVGNRRIIQPFDPMWSLDLPAGGGLPAYHAANHHTMTDARALATVLSLAGRLGGTDLETSAGWLRTRAITSLDGRDDFSYVTRERLPAWGSPYVPTASPFFAYGGDEPLFRRAAGDALTLRSDAGRAVGPGLALRAGAGVTYEEVSLWQFDYVDAFAPVHDSLRTYHAFAPGGFGYAQGHWTREGMVLDAGLRAQYFTSGQSPGLTIADTPGVWSFSPRFGMSFPISNRNAISGSYVRIDQNPMRDALYENRPISLNRHPLGNSALRTSTVISYQGALRHVFDERRAVSLALFYRDLLAQVGTRDADPRAHATRLAYLDVDEGHAVGFEVAAEHHRDEESRIDLTYTWMEAWGTQSREEGIPYGSRLGDRAQPIGDHPLDWDRRHSITLSALWPFATTGSMGWSTVVGSGLPWTPRPRRTHDADLSPLNTRRLGWSEQSALSIQWAPARRSAWSLGLEVRNVFDWRGAISTTVDGSPNPVINTVYDDYSAYRTETSRGGGAYWDEAAGEWVPVHDPRLSSAPRALRFQVAFRR
jgi:hypothetical protein